MEFRVLGPFEVVAGEAPLALGGPKQRMVLATLVLRANEVVSAGALAGALWGDAAPRSATGVVRTYVSRLRRALATPEPDGARLVGRSPGYVLEVDPDRVDARRFESLAAAAREALSAGRLDAAVVALDRALGLWRGDALADLAGAEAFRPAAARLEQMRSAALEDRIDAELALGRHAEVVGELEALTARHPFRERFWGQLIVAHYRCGRQADALVAYQRVRVTLGEQMGLEPGPELKALERQVLDHAQELRWRAPTGHDDAWSPSPSPPAGAVAGDGDGDGEGSPVPGRGTWPDPPTRFFGRAQEVPELEALLGGHRLVTLVGAPGCGKTRLAVEVVRHVAARFPGGVWCAELAPLTDPASVARAVGVALGVPEEAGRPFEDTLVEALDSAEPRLVLLDNCEHVIGAAADLARRLVAGCRSLTRLATTRAPLRLPGERVWDVPPLDRAAAASLFVDRAALVRGGLRLDRSDEAAVDEVCDRLDRLPLALELSSAWTRVLSPREIADRLAGAQPLPDRWGRGTDARHETMAATVDSTYRLLPPGARRLFGRLSVFAGGFDLEAVEAIAGPGGDDALGDLAALVEHSLVTADIFSTGPTRYRMLEPVRQCAEALLAASDEHAAVRRAHAEHYLRLARRFDPWGLRRARAAVPLRRIEQEESNLLAALHWTVGRAEDLGVELCEALAPFWDLGGRVNHGRAWMERMLASETVDPGLRARALPWSGRLAWRQGDYGGARRLLEESFALLCHVDDPAAEINGRRILALVAFSEGDGGAAVALCRECIALSRAVDSEIDLIWSRATLGWAHYVDGDVASGDEQMEAALAANRAVGNATVTAHVRLGLHHGAFLAGDTGAQRGHLIAALAAKHDADGFLDESDWLWCAAVLAATEGRFEPALRLAGGAQALSRRTSKQNPKQLEIAMMAPFERVHGEVSRRRADHLVAAGARMSWDELVADVVAEPPTGRGGARRGGRAPRPPR